MKKFIKKFKAEGYLTFNSIDGEFVLLSDKEESESFNDFKLQDIKSPATLTYKPEILTPHIGKKIKITLEVIEDGN